MALTSLKELWDIRHLMNKGHLVAATVQEPINTGYVYQISKNIVPFVQPTGIKE